ncbi:MAG TPA: dethiobiotin synthase [Burkholderiales bacterium]|nr:dethiobiotin synthase [Burkholderiales bacterium]
MNSTFNIQHSTLTRQKSRGYFVTGTDTGVGKTRIATALLRAFARRGLRAVGMKPVAAGCEQADGALVSEDVTALTAASTVAAPVDLINPYRFQPAIAPHLAAELAGETISLQRIRDAYVALEARADRVVVEGAGGFLVPLNEREDFGDLARLLELPVLVVVGMRLGCLNHALLTAEAVQRRGLLFAGWVANRLDATTPVVERNVQTLCKRLNAPLLGIVPFAVRTTEAEASYLDLQVLENSLR